ncbi:MAG: galactitol-1-phosphate 5-dehydrogenase [Bryobacterales bacterium]|nr:galactitol-1-phosphate 5-dehydrogenase [Bryobacterales bacterium]
MKALLLEDYKKLTVVDFPEPETGPDDVLVRVASCGICGSDVHGFDGGSGRRIPPVIMGHEASGTVAQTGSNVKRFKQGDRVTFDSMINCGRCPYCRKGQPNLCADRRVLGVSCGDYRRHGAFAEYVAVPQHIVYAVPDTVSFDQAAMVEPVSVALHAANLAGGGLGDSCVVVGAGMIGLLTVQAMRIKGCGQIIAVDLDDSRLALAKTSGADVTINAKNTSVPERVRELTGGEGADIVMEAVGTNATVLASIDSVRKGGTVVLIGNVTKDTALPLQSVVTREVRLQGSCASANDYTACLDLIGRGAFRVEPMISATAPLERGAEMFDRLYAHEAGLTKVILKP